MLNNWCGQGRLTKDVELRYTASQMAVASFTIACERDYKPKDRERETDWIDVVAWNSNAEFVNKYFRKGDMVIISGHLQTRTYEDKNGVKRKATEVVVDKFNFGGSKRQDSAQGHPNSQYGQYGQQGTPANGSYSPSNASYGGGGNNYTPNNAKAAYGAQSGLYGQNGNPDYSQGIADGFMNIPDGIDEELPFA